MAKTFPCPYCRGGLEENTEAGMAYSNSCGVCNGEGYFVQGSSEHAQMSLNSKRLWEPILNLNFVDDPDGDALEEIRQERILLEIENKIRELWGLEPRND